jgi:outer membrane protein OmpA-like peptidoglycan-associated protein
MMLYQESEFESEVSNVTSGPLRIFVRYGRRSSREFEWESFDPRPPQTGTTLLTRFLFGGHRLRANHREEIRRLAIAIITLMPRMTTAQCVFIELEGHEDEVGDPARFGALGLRRAESVALELISQLRKAATRIAAASRRDVNFSISTAGPTRPIRSNVTADGRALNRHVEVRLQLGPCIPGSQMA